MSVGGIGGIDSSRIQAMMEQLKAAATRPGAQAVAPGGVGGPGAAQSPVAQPGVARPDVARVDFADALKSSLAQVSAAQQHSSQLSQRFTMGDESVSLSDAMVAMQKSSIAFQATVQVRNKLVSAYHEIMNMQV
jgi:flagellar hook-basal body complex protein FliE